MRIGSQNGINNTGISLQFIITELQQGTVDEVRQAAQELVQGKTDPYTLQQYAPAHIIIAPQQSYQIEAAAILAEFYNKITLVYSPAAPSIFICPSSLPVLCSSPGVRRFPSLFSILTPPSRYTEPFIQFIKHKAVTTIGIVMEEDELQSQICTAAIQQATDKNINVVYSRTLYNLTSFRNETSDETQLVQSMAQLRSSSPNSLVVCISAPLCYRLIELFYEYGYSTSAMFFSDCVGSEELIARLGKKAAYLMGIKQWDQRLKGSQYTESKTALLHQFAPAHSYLSTYNDTSNTTTTAIDSTVTAVPSPVVWSSAFLNLTGTIPTSVDASFYATLDFLYSAVAFSNTTDVQILKSAMENVQEISFYGVVSK